MAVVAFGGSQ
jgi:hypothetical protein